MMVKYMVNVSWDPGINNSKMGKLMFKLKWFKTDLDLLLGDLVYFDKMDGALDIKWTIGMVESQEMQGRNP